MLRANERNCIPPIATISLRSSGNTSYEINIICRNRAIYRLQFVPINGTYISIIDTLKIAFQQVTVNIQNMQSFLKKISNMHKRTTKY